MIVLIVGGIVTSLLTLYALMRAWNLAFWREDREDDDATEMDTRLDYLDNAPAGVQTERRVIPRIMTAATAGMVAVSALTPLPPITAAGIKVIDFNRKSRRELLVLSSDISHSIQR